jgi:hypothetical protein
VLPANVGIIMNRVFGIVSIWLPLDVNGITQDTFACFFTTFVTAFWEIFLEYYWNISEKIFKRIL